MVADDNTINAFIDQIDGVVRAVQKYMEHDTNIDFGELIGASYSPDDKLQIICQKRTLVVDIKEDKIELHPTTEYMEKVAGVILSAYTPDTDPGEMYQ